MGSKYNSHLSNETCGLIPYSKDMRVIGSSWKFKLKRESKGNIFKYKARLVA